MPIPSVAEQAIYDDDVKESQDRLAVVVSRPFWTAQVTDTFGGVALDPTLWKSTQPEPEVAGGTLNIKSYGQPPHDVVVSRPLWFPTNDLTKGFVLTINAIFPELNPGYTTLIAAGGLEGQRAKIADPLRIYQAGENSLISGVVAGDIVVESGTFVGTAGFVFANDQLTHEYKLTWDPDALDPFETGAARITIEVDSVVRIETTDPQESREVIQETNTVRPFMIQIGTMSDFDQTAQDAVVGDPAAGVDILQVQDVTVDQLGAEGFETETFPAWTTANAGGTLDTAALGERFVLDGETWAKLPNIVDWSVEQGRDRESDSFRLALTGADRADPDSNDNIFQDDHWLRRPITIDVRVLNEAGSATTWKRQIAGVIEDYDMEVGDAGEVRIVLTGRDRATLKMDTFISANYANPTTTIDAVNIGFNMAQILEDIVDVSDRLYDGDALGATDTDIHASTDLTPEALTAGGGPLLQAFTNVCDEIGVETWRRYAVTGTGRYGEIVVQRHNEGLGAERLNSRGRAWSMTPDAEPATGVGGDAYWQTGVLTGFFPANAELRLGLSAGTSHHLFLFVPFTRIPPGANIVSAFIGFDALGAGGGVTFETDISAEDVDLSTLPTTQAAAEALVLTTASVAWDATASWADNAVVRTPDFAAVIQEVIDRPGYAAGNPLLVVIRTSTASGTFDFTSNSGGGSFVGPRLIIEFDDGARYVFRGKGAASGRTNIVKLHLHETARDGVGQIVVVADNMIQTAAVFSGGEPGPANFPRAPYPPAGIELRSSLSESGLFFTLPLVRFDDLNGHRRRGGPQMGRFFRRQALRRVVDLQLHAHDWLAPSDEVGIDDPAHSGFAADETWVVDSLAMTFREGMLSTDLRLSTSDVVRALTRGL